MEEFLEEYDAPVWARTLAVQPKCRTKFTMKPTPIHRWNLPDLPPEFEVSVKRDDLTGSTCSGNKIRKLDFCFGDALSKKADCVVTLGGIGSNHARATALAARQLGLASHLFLITKEESIEPEKIKCTGNHLLHRLSGANIYYLPVSCLEMGIGGMTRYIERFCEKLRSEGKEPYVIPPGGSSAIGAWGYIDAWQEMMDQGVLERFDDMVLATGSAGCVSAVAIANYLTGSKLKIHGVTIGQTTEACYDLVQEHLDEFKVQANSREVVNIIGGYIGESYGKCTEDDLRFIMKVMSYTGLSLDPDFTAKALKGMLNEMKERPEIFQGRRVLFLHSGGIFGLYDGRIEDIVAGSTSDNIMKATEVIPLKSS